MARKLLIGSLLIALLLAACADTAGSDTTAATTSSTAASTTTSPTPAAPIAAPFHPIPDNSVVVWGIATSCEMDPEGGTNPDGSPGWLYTCELDMSDPRVSGTEIHDALHFVVGRAWAESGGVWVAENATLTNEGGSWSGSVQATEDGGSRPVGEAHYVGEGAYEGLQFHYYFYDGPYDDAPRFHGWISTDT